MGRRSLRSTRSALCRVVEAAGIEPASLVFEKRRRCATFVVKAVRGNELQVNSLPFPVPWSPLESP